MLTLERMEIQGFKSFFHRTDVVFDKRVTGVVGPNGCGKSNILDAISWVLGEQSVKTLRGSRMLDVLFNGSERLKPVGLASVSVTLGSPEGEAGGPRKTTISRRLHRSGDSEYLLNDVPCRLRDIQDILHGTGMGVRAYSFIEQGKIGTILSSRPHERRLLIEEAAGITKFRARRREAELKLEAAQANLVRVQDILREIEGRMATLKRQASRARRHKVLREELETTLGRLYALEYHRLVTLEREVVERHTAETDLRLALASEVSQREAELEALRLTLEKTEASLSGANERLHELGLETDRARQSIVYGKERLEEAMRRAVELEGEHSGALERLGEAEIARDRAEHVLREGAEASQEVVGVAAELGLLRARTLQESTATDTLLEQLREEELALVSRAAELANALEGRGRLVVQHEARQSRLGAERERLNEQHESALEREIALAVGLAEAEARFDALGSDLDRQRSQAQRAGETAARALSELEEHSRRTAQLAERLRALDELVERGRDLGAAVEQAMAHLERQSDFTPSGVVADHLEVEPAHEAAVEAALADPLGAILVDSAERVRQALGHVQEPGRVSFVVRGEDPSASGGRLALPVHEGVVGWLVDLVRPDGQVAAALAARAAGILVMEDLGSALELAALRSDLSFVTLAGERVEPGGWIGAGAAAGDGVLALRRERRELAEQVEEARRLEERSQESAAEAQRVRAAADEEVERLLVARHQGEKEILSQGRDLEAAHEASHRLGKNLEAVDLEVESLQEDLERLLAEQQEDERSLVDMEGRRRELETRLKQARERRERMQQEMARFTDELSETEAVRARADEALAGLRTEHRSLEQSVVGWHESLERLRREQQQNETRRGELEHDIEQSELRLESLMTETAEMEQRIRAEQAAVSETRHQLIESDGQLKEKRREAEEQVERVQVVAIERTRLEGELRRLAERCREELKREPQELSGPSPCGPTSDQEPCQQWEATAGDGTAGEETELEELRLAADGLRLKLDRLGPVNVLAIEEYEELSGRQEFLSGQLGDLTGSIDSLNQTIARINRTSRVRFREAFEAVNAHFSDLFSTLFGGGRAELRLTDSEDLLEAGIEIVAQPPGKRLQNIMLLSGGEKALTALALLFGLFRYKPSPFCILDEVDAPLDEANIERFVGLLKELTRDTQFILITHSTTTMKAVEMLYGVTMEEPGVSQLVSVNLERSAA